MKLFPGPDDEPAPSFTDPEDLAFFRLHPERNYRAREPRPNELKQAARRGHRLELAPGQTWAVIVTRVSNTFITTLGKVRLDQPGVYPDNDDDIRGAFKGPRPVAPAGVPA